MSGGHWAYQQNDLRNFGQDLLEEPEATLHKLGSLFVAMSIILNRIDRCYSGDASTEEVPALLAELEGLMK